MKGQRDASNVVGAEVAEPDRGRRRIPGRILDLMRNSLNVVSLDIVNAAVTHVTARSGIVVMDDLSDIVIGLFGLLNVVLPALTSDLHQLNKMKLRRRWLVVAATRKTRTDRHQRTAPAHARENIEASAEAAAHYKIPDTVGKTFKNSHLLLRVGCPVHVFTITI